MSDFIERKDIVKWLGSIQSDCGRYQDMWHYGEALEQIIKLLDTDVAPVRHGHWVESFKVNAPPTLRSRWICSWCGNVQTYGATDYCPNCGARMDGEE